MLKTNSKQGRLTEKTDKEPVGNTTANFATHYLAKPKQSIVKRRQTFFYQCFIGLFFVLGIWLTLFLAAGNPVYRGGGPPFSGQDTIGDIMCFTISIAFTLVGFAGLFCERSLVIDHERQEVYQREGGGGHLCDFRDIKALQLLRRISTDSDGDEYWSYELNLVLADQRRINVLSHGGEESIRRDAKLLSRFLKKPLLDD